ncbi:RagB/SusD family nutrient uptake outer membrane protein [Pedobacter gandavensis]|uniref:RagB/SusD family nutrient uptake outer membrane protein n=1 Tax=Pedobacter gandavensis TaxID=2679963 RepID=UPI00292F4810|nr:RagB/SusD family nutrient uptake outer membrane protein [Pedobacter gandavensis]
MKKFLFLLSGCMFIMTINGCKKDFLNAKPSTNIVQPVTLEDFQLLLDNIALTNGVGLGVMGADEYRYSSDATWLAVPSITARNSYIWAKDLFGGGAISVHWVTPYQSIFYANNVLVGIEKIERESKNAVEWDRIKGWALFLRAYAYYDLVNNFAPIYDEKTASTDLGVPLRLNPSIDEILPRSSVQLVFERIFKDLGQASVLLNTALPVGRSRPSKVAAHALFSKIFLNMGKYNQAELHADSCLSLYSKLIDYNTLSKISLGPFLENHDEQIYARQATPEVVYANLGNTTADVAPELIELYGANDLRLNIFYTKQTNGTYRTKRSYFGNLGIYPFLGLSTNEVYLIKAECLARRGEVQPSMDVLNQLLIKRWNPDATFPPVPFKSVKAANTMEALAKVLLERRKELAFRGSRWDDLKRFNKAGANITLMRTINGQTYALPPNDPRYVFPIPDSEISLSGIQQNIR